MAGSESVFKAGLLRGERILYNVLVSAGFGRPCSRSLAMEYKDFFLLRLKYSLYHEDNKDNF